MEYWWLGLDPHYVDYAELKQRGTVAQGWPLLGDLSALVPLAGRAAYRAEFDRLITDAFWRPGKAAWLKTLRRPKDRDRSLDDQLARAQSALWHYLQLQPGDVVVALEGMRAVGLCRVTGGYWYDPDHHYGQCFGHDAVWHDWSECGLPALSHVPSRLLAAKRIGAARSQVKAAWLAVSTQE